MPHPSKTRYSIDHEKNIYRHWDTKEGPFTSTIRLFLKWRGSCAKLLWPTFIPWIICYVGISLVYHLILFTEPKSRQMQMFEMICVYASRFQSLVPITFLIGFYVTQIVNRWWDQFMSLPWPDNLAIKLVNVCPGTVSIYTFILKVLYLNL